MPTGRDTWPTVHVNLHLLSHPDTTFSYIFNPPVVGHLLCVSFCKSHYGHCSGLNYCSLDFVVSPIRNKMTEGGKSEEHIEERAHPTTPV